MNQTLFSRKAIPNLKQRSNYCPVLLNLYQICDDLFVHKEYKKYQIKLK